MHHDPTPDAQWLAAIDHAMGDETPDPLEGGLTGERAEAVRQALWADVASGAHRTNARQQPDPETMAVAMDLASRGRMHAFGTGIFVGGTLATLAWVVYWTFVA